MGDITMNSKTFYEKINNTENVFSDSDLIYQCFEKQVSKKPKSIALIFNEEQLTYEEVNKKANQLAHFLMEQEVKPRDIVAIILERSFEMIISILAVMKVGAAYLPIEPHNPVERTDFYLENSKASYIITKDNCYTNNNNYRMFNWDNAYLLDKMSFQNLDKIISAEDLAYIIYTSGSTGKPKGVMIKHVSLINRLNWHIKNFKLNENDIFLLKTSYSFDVSVWELLCWSIVGGKLVILEPRQEKNPRKIVKAIEKYSITMIHFVPSVLELFIEYIKSKFDLNRILSLNYIVTSGEELLVRTAVSINNLLYKKNGTELWNLYGPTEATIDVTAYRCCDVKENQNRIPIGLPIDNIYLYVLDEKMNLCNVGQKGELYIGGIGVAQGYINNDELTKDRFIDNPFGQGGIIYKTGDCVAWNSNGELEFFGRLDSQIKLRGLRIELGEIDKTIMTYNDVCKAITILDNRNDKNSLLVAFIKSERSINTNDLIAYLEKKIPKYMIPSKFIYINEIPTTVNGKIDRNTLLNSIN